MEHATAERQIQLQGQLHGELELRVWGDLGGVARPQVSYAIQL